MVALDSSHIGFFSSVALLILPVDKFVPVQTLQLLLISCAQPNVDLTPHQL